jgi:lysine biosynthesis protein LysW
MALCPSCVASIHIHDNTKIGKLLTCSECRIVREVIWMDPVELDFPYDDEDEFEDEGFDD